MSQSLNPSLNPAAMTAIAKASFTANTTGYCHEHNHLASPHMHTNACDRFVSGIDKNRQSRFYFTNRPTPIRVYLNYNERLLPAQSTEPEQINPTLNGRKLSPKTLRSQLKVSPQFIDDAKNYIFVKDTLSLVPTLPTINVATSNNIHLTMAEMAAQPLHLPPISQSQHHHHKSKANPRLASIKSRKLTESSVHSNVNSVYERRLDDFINE